LREKRVEPNSGLGKAFKYLVKHWEGLTKFSRGCKKDCVNGHREEQ
jgi:hypothetical protein